MHRYGNAIQAWFGQWQIVPTVGVSTPLLIGGLPFTGVINSQVQNTSAVDGDQSRLSVVANGTNVTLVAANAAQSTALITGGPTGSQAVLRTLGAYPLVFGTNNTLAGQISADGAWSIAAPTADTGLTVQGAPSNFTVSFTGAAGVGASDGLLVTAGTNGSDTCALLRSEAGSTYLKVAGDGGVTVGSPTGGDQGLGTINATGLFVNGVAVGGGTTIVKAIKTASQTVTNSTTYVVDTALQIALTAGKYYAVTVLVVAQDSSASGGGLRNAFNYTGTGGTLSGTVTSNVASPGIATLVAPLTSITTGNSFLLTGASASLATGMAISYTLVVFGGSVGGTFELEFAQNNANASTISILPGSYISAVQLN